MANTRNRVANNQFDSFFLSLLVSLFNFKYIIQINNLCISVAVNIYLKFVEHKAQAKSIKSIDF